MFSLHLSFKQVGFKPQQVAAIVVTSAGSLCLEPREAEWHPAVENGGNNSRSLISHSFLYGLGKPAHRFLLRHLVFCLSCWDIISYDVIQLGYSAAECPEPVALEAISLYLLPGKKHRHALGPKLIWSLSLSIFQCKGLSTLL